MMIRIVGLRWIVPAAFVMAACITHIPFAFAQNASIPNALQGFSQNKEQPVHIEAASLEVRDKDKQATFSGDVKVTQGDTTMRCKSLVVFYDQDNAPNAMKSAQPGPGGRQSIRRLEARGGVVVTQKEQTASGDTGIFDMKSNTITLAGNVVIAQGQNVLRGERLVVDVASGAARVEAGKGQGGRVQGLFVPGSSGDLKMPGSKDADKSDKGEKSSKAGNRGGSAKEKPQGAPRSPSGVY